MATKTASRACKKPAAHHVRTSAAKRKGQRYACETCGLIVTVDEPCGCTTDMQELQCCGRPMRSRK